MRLERHHSARTSVGRDTRACTVFLSSKRILITVSHKRTLVCDLVTYLAKKIHTFDTDRIYYSGLFGGKARSPTHHMVPLALYTREVYRILYGTAARSRSGHAARLLYAKPRSLRVYVVGLARQLNARGPCRNATLCKMSCLTPSNTSSPSASISFTAPSGITLLSDLNEEG